MKPITPKFKIATIIISLLLSGCANDVIFKHTPGTTYGEIHVGDARVSSRERLVTDRLVQDAWLKNELANSDKVEFGTQGAVDLRSFAGSSTQLQANLDKASVGLYQSQMSQANDSIHRQQEQANLDNELLKQYKLRQLDALAQKPASDFTYTPPASGAAASGNATPTLPTGPQTKETLRSIDTSKLTIDPSSLKLPNNLKPSPEEVLRDKLDYRALIRNEIIENSLDDRHDLMGNTLLRLDLDATVQPANDTSAWAKIDVKINSSNWKSACTSREFYHGKTLYESWKDYLEQTTQDKIILLMRESFEVGRSKEEKASGSDYEKLKAYTSGMVAFMPDYLLLNIQQHWLEESKDHNYMRANRIIHDIAEKKIKEILSEKKEGAYENARHEYEQVIYKEIAKAYARILSDSLGGFINANFDQNKIVITNNKKDDEFCEALSKLSQIYTYGETPKNTVQRVAEVASRRNVNEWLLALSFLGGNTAAGTLYQDYLKVNEGIFQALHRQPLTVGYSNGTSKSESDGTYSANFGWVLGPHFGIADDGKNSHYRHTLTFNSLSAVLSIPGWLSEVTLEASPSWVNEDGSLGAQGFPKKLPVRLNPDFSTIAEVLANKPTRVPKPFTYQILTFDEGSTANVIIPGQNLWRNPMVFIGSQKADDFGVLPDMRSLWAQFKDLKLQKTTPKEAAPLEVWTSEGHAPAGMVYITPKEKPAPDAPKAALKSAAIIANGPMEISLAPPKKSFYAMKVFIGGLNTNEQHEVQATSVLNGGAAISVKTPKFAKAKTGEDVLVQVFTKDAPDNRPAQPFGGPLTAVYYATEQDAQAKVEPKEVGVDKLSQTTFTITLPTKYAQAYPGSDAESLPVKLEPKDPDAPAITAEACKVDSGKGNEGKCQFKIKVGGNVGKKAIYTIKLSANDLPIPVVAPATITINAKEKKVPSP